MPLADPAITPLPSPTVARPPASITFVHPHEEFALRLVGRARAAVELPPLVWTLYVHSGRSMSWQAILAGGIVLSRNHNALLLQCGGEGGPQKAKTSVGLGFQLLIQTSGSMVTIPRVGREG